MRQLFGQLGRPSATLTAHCGRAKRPHLRRQTERLPGGLHMPTSTCTDHRHFAGRTAGAHERLREDGWQTLCTLFVNVFLSGGLRQATQGGRTASAGRGSLLTLFPPAFTARPPFAWVFLIATGSQRRLEEEMRQLDLLTAEHPKEVVTKSAPAFLTNT